MTPAVMGDRGDRVRPASPFLKAPWNSTWDIRPVLEAKVPKGGRVGPDGIHIP